MSGAAPASLFRNRNFVLLWCAYAISALGDHLSEMAILKTQNALGSDVDVTPMMARMTFVFMLPFFLFGPVMGYLADRLPRRGLMIGADLVRAGLMASFAGLIAWFTTWFPQWGPFIPLAIVGLFAALFSPSRSALLPTLVGLEQLVPANALINGLGVLATIVSAVIGGHLAKHYAPELSFRVDAFTFAASAVFVFLIVPPAKPGHGGPRKGMFDEVIDGFRYLRGHRRVQQIFVFGVVFWLAAAAVRSVMPALVKDVYQRADYFDISLFQARMGLGMVVGSLILTVLGDALRSEIAVTWSLIGAAASGLLLAASVLLPLPVGAAYHTGGVSVIALGAFGAALIASYNALLQRIVPDRYRGRTFGVLDVCTMAGLLFATGLLGIPQWPHLDRWAGLIVLGVAVLLGGVGLASLMVRVRQQRGPERYATALVFARNLNEIICKFWYRLRRIGPCTVPRTGPVIITANHTVSADPLMICAGCRYRPIAFMIAREFSDIPVARWFVRLIECIPVRRDGRDAAATKAAIRKLRDGHALAIFIEGRIPAPGETVEPKDGVALLALRTGAPVIPAHLSGNRYCESVARGFFARHRTVVRFGPPVDLAEFGGRTSRADIAAATAKIYRAIHALGTSEDSAGQPHGAPPSRSGGNRP